MSARNTRFRGREGTSPIELVKGLYDALGRGDVEGILATLSPDVTWSTPETMPWSTGAQEGHEAVVRYLTILGEHLEDIRFDTDLKFLDAGDWIVAFGWITGRAIETKRSFRSRFAHLWQVADSLIVRHEGYPDAAAILEAMDRHTNSRLPGPGEGG